MPARRDNAFVYARARDAVVRFLGRKKGFLRDYETDLITNARF